MISGCSCDVFCDDPCPVHARENALQNEVITLRAALAAEREAHAETGRQLADREMRLDAQPTGTRICDSIACRAAVIRHDGPGRSNYCAAGHKARWVAIDSQDDVLSRAESAERERDDLRAMVERLERVREAAERATDDWGNGGTEHSQNVLMSRLRAALDAAKDGG